MMSDAKDNFIDVPEGTALFKQGQIGGSMYIVDSGQIDLIQKTAGGDVVTATLGPGECFGEAALMDNAHAFRNGFGQRAGAPAAY